MRLASPRLAICGAFLLFSGFTLANPPETGHRLSQKHDLGAPARADQSAGGSGQVQPALDFEIYRIRIEPIFLKPRQGGVRCYECHSMLATRLRLEPLSAGSSSWTEEQSRRNFEVVSQLVTLTEPLTSHLLLHPLAQEAGGDPLQTGGKFWASQDDPEWKMLAEWVRHGDRMPPTAQATSPPGATDALDFQFFKTSVEPIFLKERPGHARCYGCHILSNRVFHLETLSPGSSDWTDEQSQRNFQSALQLVVPGDPASSRLLIHPLAPEAGGDPFHSGGRQFTSPNDPDWLALAEWVRGVRKGVAYESSPGAMTRIYVTNSAGDTVDVIDSATNKILQKVSLSGRPNNIAITKDGDRVLVGIRTEPGVVDVIDTTSLKRSKSISVDGSVHKVFVTPDGKYAVSGSIENKAATIIDLQSEQAVWEVKFDSAVRPMAFEANPDGSTSRIFVQLTGLNGFAVVDFAKRAEVARIRLPDQPGGFGIFEGRLGIPSHGIGTAPDGKSLWVNSTLANAVFKYSLPGLKLMGYATLPEVHPLGRPLTGSVPEWITFTPDSRVVYVSNSAAGSVSAIDANTLKEIAVVPVGEVPKRMNTLVLH